MKRPMVWFLLMFLSGELLCLAGLHLWQASLIGLLCILMTGSRKAYFRVTWIRHLLPVFILAGFVVCSAAVSKVMPDGRLLQRKNVYFSGKVTMVSEKENSFAVSIGSCLLYAGEEKAEEGLPSACQGALLYVDKTAGGSLYAGARICGRGRITLPEQASNPGQFDARRYQASRGICYIIFPDEIRTLKEASSFRRLVDDFRRRMKTVFDSLFGETEAGFLDAMILGDQSLLEADTKTLFRKLGIVHILAISGMHLSLIGSGLYKLLKRTGLPQRPCALLAAFTVMTYARFVHAGPATMRAVIMFCMMMTAEYLGRKYDGLSALALAGLVILAADPLALYQSGLWFAFIAVLSLYLLAPAILKLLNLPKKSRQMHMAYIIVPPAAVTLGTMPLTVYCYGEIPLAGLVMNLLVMPVMGILMPLGLLTGLSGLVSFKLASFLAGSLRLILRLYALPKVLGALQDHLIIKTGCQPLTMILAVYAGLAFFLLLSARTGYKDRRLLLILCCALILALPVRRIGQMTAFLDVGQGQCIFIRSSDGRTMLYDGGSSDVKQAGKYRIMPFLDYYGVKAVDEVFVSHGDYDHYSGIQELIEAGRIRRLCLTAAGREDEGCLLLARTAMEKDIPVTYIRRGDCLQLGDLKISCIYPAEKTQMQEINDRSMVLELETERYSLLLTGDISSEAEAALLSGRLPAADILQVPHHGSKFSSSAAFLAAVHPSVSIVSAGAGNPYGHPDKETLDRLEAAGSGVCITFKTGAVLIRPDQDDFRVSLFCPDGSSCEKAGGGVR